MASLEEVQKNESNARERRAKARAEKKKKMSEREELLSKLKNTPLPSERKSIFSQAFPDSNELDWTYIDGLGWYHMSEHRDFLSLYIQCSVRKKWARKSECYALNDGSYVCEEEFRTGAYVECGITGHWVRKEECVEVAIVNSSSGLGSCYILKNYAEENSRMCDFSKKLYLRKHTAQVKGNGQYKCIGRNFIDKKNFTQCYNCNGIFPLAEAPYRSDVERYECNECNEIRFMGEIIHAHNYNKYPPTIAAKRVVRRCTGGNPVKDSNGFTFYAGTRNNSTIEEEEVRKFGVEAETEIYRRGAEKEGLNRYRLAKNVIETLGKDFVIVKEDGTLTANEHYGKKTGYAGFEVVTAPADLETHRKRWAKLVQCKGYAHFRAWDEYDTCGFHVHVSREALTYLQIGRILMFINHKANAKFIHKVAGRGSDRFCRYIPKEPSDKTHPASDVLYPEQRVISKEEEDRRNRSRRVAVNLSNPNTIEFRIFRGTMNPRHIIRNLEFVDAVCDFCYPGNYSISDMANYNKFIAFVNGHKKKWPLFAEWLANQKFIEIRKLSEKAKADKELADAISKRTIKPENCEEADRTKKEDAKLDEPPPATPATFSSMMLTWSSTNDDESISPYDLKAKVKTSKTNMASIKALSKKKATQPPSVDDEVQLDDQF